jgi:hypothetical protein
VSALGAVRRYHNRGFAVVPIPHRSKRPILEGWESLSLTTDELSEHFNGKPQNVGLLLGKPSGGLIDVDQDAPEEQPSQPLVVRLSGCRNRQVQGRDPRGPRRAAFYGVPDPSSALYPPER